MKKKYLFLIMALIMSSISFGQKIVKDKEVKEGRHTIKIVLNDDNTYGYEIQLEKKTVLHQKFKPYILIQQGFEEKESALAVAKWHVKEIERTGKKQLSLSSEKARQLGVSEKDLLVNKSKN